MSKDVGKNPRVLGLFSGWSVSYGMDPPLSGSIDILRSGVSILLLSVISGVWAEQESRACLDFCWETNSQISRPTPASAGSSFTTSWATRECHLAAYRRRTVTCFKWVLVIMLQQCSLLRAQSVTIPSRFLSIKSFSRFFPDLTRQLWRLT